MSMLLMLIALLGALMVIAAGMVVVRWGTRVRDADAPEPEPAAEPTEPELPGVSGGVGGYWPFPPEAGPGERGPQLPPQTLSRVRGLLASDRGGEAVEVIRRETGMDLHRAREAVETIRREKDFSD